jgi:predicted PurR-regulated permease PerM
LTEAMLVRVVYRGGLVLLAVVAVVLLFIELKWVLVQLFAASIVAAGMAPVVAPLTDPERTRRWRWRPPSAVVVLVIYLILGLIVIVVGTLLLQAVLTQATTLLQRAPEFALSAQDLYARAAERWTLLDQLDIIDLFGGASGLTQSMVGVLAQVLNVAGLLLALFGGALNVIFVLFMALYLTIGGRTMLEYLIVFVPSGRRPQAGRVIGHISERLGRWVLGEMELCTIIGVGAGIGLWLIGVPGAALLGLVWAVSELIPGIGPFVAAVPTILLGFTAGPTTGILATIFTVAWSQIENNVVVPRVMSRAVKLNPLVVLLALLAGNQLLGLAGALFAIPAAAALAVLVDELRHERLMAEQESGLQLDTPAVPSR